MQKSLEIMRMPYSETPRVHRKMPYRQDVVYSAGCKMDRAMRANRPGWMLYCWAEFSGKMILEKTAAGGRAAWSGCPPQLAFGERKKAPPTGFHNFFQGLNSLCLLCNTAHKKAPYPLEKAPLWPWSTGAFATFCIFYTTSATHRPKSQARGL
jgi:hypothetical protein